MLILLGTFAASILRRSFRARSCTYLRVSALGWDDMDWTARCVSGWVFRLPMFPVTAKKPPVSAEAAAVVE